jgi:non-heme Fe2+,alpha-ketoglutarate-dependent halogenase
MGKMLSASAVEQYRQAGYYCPVRVMSRADALTLRRKLEAAEAAHGGPFEGSYRHKPHLLFTWLDALIRTPAILDAVEDVIGPNILCWSSSFFTKEGNTSDYVSWHQDATYWGLSAPDVVTAWVAFTVSSPQNGNMRVVPGTHRAQMPHADTFAEHNLLSRGQEVQVEVDETQAVDISLEPGEMSLHHVLIVHGSGPNASSDRRVGFAIRYIPTHLRQIAGSRDSASLVRGEDAYRHFEHEPRAARDLEPAMVALHAEICARQAKVFYRGTDKTGF